MLGGTCILAQRLQYYWGLLNGNGSGTWHGSAITVANLQDLEVEQHCNLISGFFKYKRLCDAL